MSHATAEEVNTVAALRKNGTISTRVAIVLTLLGCDKVSCQIGPLARRLGVGVAVASMVGDTLVREGHVDRCYPADDLRKAALALTPTGRAVATGHLELLRAIGAAEPRTPES